MPISTVGQRKEDLGSGYRQSSALSAPSNPAIDTYNSTFKDGNNLQLATQNLQGQLDRGGINQGQFNNEVNRLTGINTAYQEAQNLGNDMVAVPPANGANFNNAKFAGVTQQHQAQGTQLTPAEAQQLGFNLSNYGDLYGDTSWYTPDGSLTGAAPSWAQSQPVQRNQTVVPIEPTPQQKALFPEYIRPSIVNQSVNYNPANAPMFREAQRTPTSQDFLPENVEASKLYQFQMDEGLNALNAQLAASGLRSSGAGMEARQKLITQLGAEEAQRQFDRADAQANRQFENQTQNQGQANNFALTDYGLQAQQLIDAARLESQTNVNQQNTNFQDAAQRNGYAVEIANRILGIQRDQADRGERYSNENFDRTYNTISMLLAQNPAQLGLQASGSLSDLYQSEGGLNAQLAAILGQGSGGGGGQQAAPQPVIPFPTPPGPNFINTQPYQALSDLNSSTGYTNAIGSFINSIL